MTFRRLTARATGAAMLFAATMAGTTALTGPAGAADGAAISEETRGQIEQIVRDYLLANPEILVEMQASL